MVRRRVVVRGAAAALRGPCDALRRLLAQQHRRAAPAPGKRSHRHLHREIYPMCVVLKDEKSL
jgi:hypothetical protein